MKFLDSIPRTVLAAAILIPSLLAGLLAGLLPGVTVGADETPAVAASDEAVDRTRESIATLDNIFKQTIVMVTDKYVHDESDFAAGSAAVLLFKNITESSDNEVRLIDATGDPYDSENVARDEFEKEGVKRLKAGAERHEQVVEKDGRPHLRVLTSVPVVMQKCVMCHAHYADAKPGEPIGAISYTVPVK